MNGKTLTRRTLGAKKYAGDVGDHDHYDRAEDESDVEGGFAFDGLGAGGY